MARNAQILPLTGIRFFLALWVALFHQTAPSRTLTDVIPHWPGPLFCFMRTGYVAVGVFFLLSGFVLSYSYPLRERWSAYRIVQFAIARFARIYPAYLLGLLLIAPLVAAHFFATNKNPAKEVVAAALNCALLQSWIPSAATSWNSPGWSLSVEAFLYCWFPFAGVALWRITRGRSLAIAACLSWVAALVVPLIAAELPVPGFGDVPATAEPFGAAFWIDLIKYNPLLHLPAFCLGIVTGRIFTRAGECESALRGRGYWLYGPALVTELLLIAFSSSIPYPLVHNGLLLPLHAAIVLGLAFGGGALARFLALTPLVFLGNASYALYILHFPVLRWMRAVSVAFFSTELTGIPITLLYLAIAIGGSCLVFKTIEEPANRFLKAQINLRLGRFRRQPGDAMAMTARSAEY